jgi:hypothetical protein
MAATVRKAKKMVCDNKLDPHHDAVSCMTLFSALISAVGLSLLVAEVGRASRDPCINNTLRWDARPGALAGHNGSLLPQCYGSPFTFPTALGT